MQKSTTLLLILFLFNTVYTLAQTTRTLIPYRIVDKWGLANFFDELVVEAKYDELDFFSNQINPTRTPHSLARVQLDGKCGYINEIGEEVIPLIYDEAMTFNGEYARVVRNGKSFTINTQNEIVPDTLYQELILEANTTAAIPRKTMKNLPKEEWKEIFQDLEAEEVRPIEPIRKGRIYDFLVRKNDKWGLVQYGSLKLPIEYDSIVSYDKFSHITYKNGKQGLYLVTVGGQPPLILLPEYDEVKIVNRKGFSSLLYWYKKDGLWGFVGFKNKLIEPQYQHIEVSKQRYFLYELILPNGKFGYYHIDLGKAFFSEMPLMTMKDMQPFFEDAEKYANKFIEEQVADLQWDKLMKEVELCLQSAMLKKTDNKTTLYYNFSTGNQSSIAKIDSNCLLMTAQKLSAVDLLTEEAVNASTVLIKTCQHLHTRYEDLILKYPNYPFSEIVQSFKLEQINSTSPFLIQSSTKSIFKKCDFSIPFYQKATLLYKYYGLAYGHLVKNGIFEHHFKK